MSTIVTRSGKGSPLTNAEVDSNFENLNTDKAELSGAVFTGAITTNSTIDGRDVATDGTKLDGIEASATADQTGAQIKTAYEAETNAFTDAQFTKLGDIEASADVTDTANVTAAGALMDSELTAIASVKALNQGVATGDSPTFAAVTSTGEITANGGIALGDNDKATFGAGDDLQIYHDNSAGHSIIRETGAGDLRLMGTNVSALNLAGDGFLAHFIDGGASTLYHNGSDKIATTSTGIDVTGTATMDGLTVVGDSIITGNIGINTGTPDAQLEINSNSGATLRLSRSDGSITTDDRIGVIEFHQNDPSGEGAGVISKIESINQSSFTGYGGLIFSTGQSASLSKSLEIGATGDISFYEDTGTTAKFFWDASAERLGIGTSSPATTLEISNSIAPKMRFTRGSSYYWDIGHTSSDFQFESQTGGIVLHLDFDGKVGIGTSSPAYSLDVSTSNILTSRIQSSAGETILELDNTATNGRRYMIISGGNSGSLSGGKFGVFDATVGATRLAIDSSGYVSIHTTSATAAYLKAEGIYGSSYAASFKTNSANSSAVVVFENTNGIVGNIGTSGSSTAYNTSSDYRLKEDDVPMTGATERVKALRPINFAWKVDGSRVDGFLAHEAQEVVPECVTGTKDAMRDEEYEVTAAIEEVRDEDDNITTEAVEAVMGTRSVPDMQGIDQSKLVPLLTAALQEAITNIESLTTRIAALEE